MIRLSYRHEGDTMRNAVRSSEEVLYRNARRELAMAMSALFVGLAFTGWLMTLAA